MKCRIFISALFLLGFITTVNAQKKQKPNIVIIMADDLGYGDLSAYGATKIKTPAVDELAKGRKMDAILRKPKD